MATPTLALLGQATMARSASSQQQSLLGVRDPQSFMQGELNRYRTKALIAASLADPPPAGIREELQAEVDEWLKPVG